MGEMFRVLITPAQLHQTTLSKVPFFPRRRKNRDFPGGSVAGTRYSIAGGPSFNPGSGNQIPHATTKTWHSLLNK